MSNKDIMCFQAEICQERYKIVYCWNGASRRIAEKHGER